MGDCRKPHGSQIQSRKRKSFAPKCAPFSMPNFPRTFAPSCELGRHISKDDMVRWQKIMYRKGWGAPNWPTQFGGTGWNVVQQHIFEEERAAANAPGQNPFSTEDAGAGACRNSATPRSRNIFCRASLRGEDWWCQGYSEPGSGSDLASLADQRGAPGRSLHRQRPEDLEHHGPVCGLDFLPWCAPAPRDASSRAFRFC